MSISSPICCRELDLASDARFYTVLRAGAQIQLVALNSTLYDANAQHMNLTDLSAEQAVSQLCSR